ncbi:MAG: cytochrome P450 [Bradyrhizobium sp.]
MNVFSVSHGSFVPPAPIPHRSPLGPLALAKALWRNPLEAWAETHFSEPIVTTSLGRRQVLLVNDPAAIRHVFLDNAANFGREPLQRRIMSSALRNGLLMADGSQWERQRRMLGPLFTRKSIKRFAVPVEQAAQSLVHRWRQSRNQVVDVAAEITLLTLEVLERTIFSEGLGRHAEEIRDSMRRYFDTIGTIEPADLLGLPDFVPRLADYRVGRELRLFNTTVDSIIANRRSRIARGDSDLPDDLLTLLLDARDPETGEWMSEQEVRANIITFIAAGHETTANAIMWSLFLLSQSPEWSQRLAAEAAGANSNVTERVDCLSQTRAVLDEALRLYPSIAAVTRCAIDADHLGDIPIKPGTMIVIAPYVLHRHRRLWEEPDVFDPARFYGSSKEKVGRFSYIPFGFGPRMCIGQPFALQEATLVLSAIMREFVPELVPGYKVWPVLKITIRPQNGLPMRLRLRADAEFEKSATGRQRERLTS